MKKLFLIIAALLFASSAQAEISTTTPATLDNISGGPLTVAKGGTGSTALGEMLTNSGGTLNTSIPVDRIVDGTTDTILSTDGGRHIVSRNTSVIAETLPRASSDGFMQGFGFTYINEGLADVKITTESMLNNAYEPFTIKKEDGCAIRSVLSTSYGLDFSSCPPKDYNANFGTRVMTSTLDGRFVYTNESSDARYYYNPSGVLTATTTATTARMDYNPDTLAARGLLMERTSTSLYSGSAAWGAFNGDGLTISSPSISGPDGVSDTVAMLTEDLNTSRHYAAHQSFSITSGTTYSWSIYLLAGTATAAQISLNATDFGSGKFANVNLTTCALGTTDGTVSYETTKLSNGWCRLKVNGAIAIDTRSSAYIFQLGLTNNDTSAEQNPSYTGTQQYIYATKLNITSDSLASSWIPGTSTRLNDSLTVSTDYLPFLDPEEGTVCVDYDTFENVSGGVIAGGVAVADVLMRINASSNLEAFDGTNTVDFGISMPSSGTRTRACVAYSGTSMNGAVNGTVGTSGTFDGNFDFSNLRFFADHNGANALGGHVHSVVVYPKALSSTDLVRASTAL